jgi:prophage regulatory protein
MRLDPIIRKSELLAITGVSIATVYRWIGAGEFPPPVKLGSNSVGWRESEVREWLESRERVGSPTATDLDEPREGKAGESTAPMGTDR